MFSRNFVWKSLQQRLWFGRRKREGAALGDSGFTTPQLTFDDTQIATRGLCRRDETGIYEPGGGTIVFWKGLLNGLGAVGSILAQSKNPEIALFSALATVFLGAFSQGISPSIAVPTAEHLQAAKDVIAAHPIMQLPTA